MRAGRYLQGVVLAILVALSVGQPVRLSGFRGGSSAVPQAQTASPGPEVRLPLQDKSVRFAVIGDSGTGEAAQFEVARQMELYRQKVKFDTVLMLGDNLYGGDSPRDYQRKFEEPYKALLDAGVKFYASLGNHDSANERFYKPFNMNGQRYYSFKLGNATIFALDSTYMDSTQLSWLTKQLEAANTPWKICFFHHPLYSDGKFHGSDLDLRTQLTPVFKKEGVGLVLSGHEHVYERILPKDDTYYFVLGNSGQLRYHNVRSSSDTVVAFDTDRAFMLVEIVNSTLNFQVISRDGRTVDAGSLELLAKPMPEPKDPQASN